ncbi:MAG: TonB family protein, partial [Nannocystaceae bacterium]
VLGLTWGGRPLPEGQGMMEVSLLDETDPERDPEPEAPELAPGKLVQLDRVTDERPPERDTPYVSEFDNRAARPTQAPNVHPQPGAPRSGDDGREGNAPQPSPPAPSPLHALPLLPGTEADDHEGEPGEATDQDDRGELATPGGHVPAPTPAGSPGERRALTRSPGSAGSFDDIEGADPDDETSVDSKRWKYASFFNRVRSAIAQHWHPEVVHAANDPDGHRYGTKTRRTRLIIALNPDGSLHRIRMDQSCDVDYLDEEAIRAVRAAAPFTNPPPGLVDPSSGFIEFGFGFIFEFGGESRIFRYKR